MTYIKRDKVRNRETGTLTSVYDTQHPDNVFDPAGGRWVAVCEDHHTLCNFPTLEGARYFAEHPQFCEACMENLEGKPARTPRKRPLFKAKYEWRDKQEQGYPMEHELVAIVFDKVVWGGRWFINSDGTYTVICHLTHADGFGQAPRFATEPEARKYLTREAVKYVNAIRERVEKRVQNKEATA